MPPPRTPARQHSPWPSAVKLRAVVLNEVAVPLSRRRRLLGPLAIAVHRAALAVVRRLPARRAPSGRRTVRIVMTNAYAMGGTIRATLTLAEQLAEHYEVEVIAVRKRGARRPF